MVRGDIWVSNNIGKRVNLGISGGPGWSPRSPKMSAAKGDCSCRWNNFKRVVGPS